MSPALFVPGCWMQLAWCAEGARRCSLSNGGFAIDRNQIPKSVSLSYLGCLLIRYGVYEPDFPGKIRAVDQWQRARENTSVSSIALAERSSSHPGWWVLSWRYCGRQCSQRHTAGPIPCFLVERRRRQMPLRCVGSVTEHSDNLLASRKRYCFAPSSRGAVPRCIDAGRLNSGGLQSSLGLRLARRVS